MPVLSTEKVQAAVDMARKGRIIVLGEGALCNPSNADLFGGLTPTDERAAKKLCQGCPWAVQCLANALLEGAPFIQGGTNIRQRKDIYRQYRIKPLDKPRDGYI